MKSSRWMGLVSALWVQSISGNNYTFSNYSVALKTILGINQVELNNLGVAKDIGKAFGVVGGLLADVLPPWSIFLIGSLLGLIGYGSQWLVISQRIAPPPLWLMSIMMCFGGNSTTWMNTAVLVTCVKNFRRNRGPVSGILKGYVGLSTAIFTDIAAALFASDPAIFVLMLAIIPLAVCTIAMFLLSPVESALPWNQQADKQETRYFSFLNAIAIILAFYLLAYDITGTHSIVVSRGFAAGLLLLLVAPACLPAFLWWKTARTSHNFPSWGSVFSHSSSKGETSTTPLLPNNNRIDEEIQQVQDKNNKDVEKCVVTAVSDSKTGLQDVKRKPKIGEDHNILQAISTVDFWLLFFTFLCGIGTGMAVLNNLGQIAQSLGYTSAAAFISLNSIFGFFGRLGSGAVSEFGIRKAGLPRPTLVAASQLMMIVGYVVLALGLPGCLYIGSIIVGLCYGIRMAVSVACASELFGLRIFGLVYNLLILNLPLGSFLFSGLLAGYLYDREAMKASVGPVFTPSFNHYSNSTWMMGGVVGQEKLWHGDLLMGLTGAGARAIGMESDYGTCLGVHCYRLVFITMGGVSILGFVLDVVLALRTRPIYAAARRKSRWPSSSSSSS